MMETYLGDEPDSSEAIEFLCLAEAGEVTHYEVLDAMMKKVKFKNKQQLATQIRSILGQEKKHRSRLERIREMKKYILIAMNII
jgi:hypothetical protein